MALVAQSGGCSLMDKVRVASALIDPSNTVGYLIVQERSKRRHLSLYSSDNNSNNNNETPNTEIEALDNPSQLEQFGNSVINRLVDEDEDGESFYTSSLEQSTTDCDLESAERNGRALIERTNLESGPDINFAILHVSYGTGETLVDVLKVEDTLDRSKGGPRVLLNGTGNALGTRTVVFWMLVVFSASACGCACLLICLQTIEDEQQQQDVPRRPVRRRLTLEEVRTRFPSYHYDDAAAAAARTTCGQDDGSGTASCGSCMGGGGGTNDQDECTICLDEFVQGDRVRKLPCGHVFHSTCIARWLIERNAVCPLCKLDLFIEEEEDDDSDSDSSNNNNNENENGALQEPPPSFWERLFRNNNNNNDSNNDTNTNASTNSEGYTQLVVPFGSAESAEALVEESRSWWPFSLETVPSADDEEEEQQQVVRSPFATAATAISSFWRNNNNTSNSTNAPRIGNVFGSRRRRYQHRHHSSNDANLLTELTEPLVSSSSSSAAALAVAEESAAATALSLSTAQLQLQPPQHQHQQPLPSDTSTSNASPTAAEI